MARCYLQPTIWIYTTSSDSIKVGPRIGCSNTWRA